MDTYPANMEILEQQPLFDEPGFDSDDEELANLSPFDRKLAKQNKKRKRVGRACVFCQRSHMSCDEGRPCKRCIARGCADQCRDGKRKRRGRKRKTPLPDDEESDDEDTRSSTSTPVPKRGKNTAGSPYPAESDEEGEDEFDATGHGRSHHGGYMSHQHSYYPTSAPQYNGYSAGPYTSPYYPSTVVYQQPKPMRKAGLANPHRVLSDASYSGHYESHDHQQHHLQQQQLQHPELQHQQHQHQHQQQQQQQLQQPETYISDDNSVGSQECPEGCVDEDSSISSSSAAAARQQQASAAAVEFAAQNLDETALSRPTTPSIPDPAEFKTIHLYPGADMNNAAIKPDPADAQSPAPQQPTDVFVAGGWTIKSETVDVEQYFHADHLAARVQLCSPNYLELDF